MELLHWQSTFRGPNWGQRSYFVVLTALVHLSHEELWWTSMDGMVVKNAKHYFLTHVSVHRNSKLIKIQPDATVCRYLFTAKSLYMFRVSKHPSSGVLKTVTATSGTGHNTGTV